MIKTTEQLREHMKQVVAKYDLDYEVTNGELIWFVCIQNAQSVSSNMNLREIASLYREGIKAAMFEDVQDWIDTLYDDSMPENYNKAQDTFLRAFVHRFLIGEDDEYHRLIEEARQLEEEE